MPDADGFTPHRMISLRFGIVLVGDRRHLAVERHVGRAGRRGADRARQPRRAEAAPQLRVDVVLREQAVRAAVGVGQDRLGAAPSPCACSNRVAISSSASSQVDALELPGALAAAADRRVEQAIGSVDALAELAAPWRRCSRRSPGSCASRRSSTTLPLLHGDGEAARVGTVERARGLDDRRRAAERLVARQRGLRDVAIRIR